MFCGCQSHAQDSITVTVIDSYTGKINFMLDLRITYYQVSPVELISEGFLEEFSLGYLRDMPINKRRNVAVAIGAGLHLINLDKHFLLVKTQMKLLYLQF